LSEERACCGKCQAITLLNRQVILPYC
jgi:hypothetical protein